MDNKEKAINGENNTKKETKNRNNSNNNVVALTTIDNPFNPITDFDNWFSTDLQLSLINHRRDTCSMLALFARTSEKLSSFENKNEIEKAIDEIIKHDDLGIYKKVVG